MILRTRTPYYVAALLLGLALILGLAVCGRAGSLPAGGLMPGLALLFSGLLLGGGLVLGLGWYWISRQGEGALVDGVRLAAALDSVAEAVVVAAEDLTVIVYNRAAARLFGRPTADIIGRSLGELMPARLRDVQVDLFLEAVATAPSTDARVRGVRMLGQHQGGLSFPMEVFVARSTVDGAVIYTAVLRDVSSQEQTLAALQESEERFRVLVEHASDAIVVLDESGRFVDANDNAERLFGLSRDELFYLSPVDVSPAQQEDGRSSAEAAAAYVRCALTGEAQVFEWLYHDSAGSEIPCEVRLVRIPVTGKTLMRGSIMDISARKKMERLLQGQRAVLERAAAGAALSEVLSQLLTLLEAHTGDARGVVQLYPQRAAAQGEPVTVKLPADFAQGLATLPWEALPGSISPESPVIVPDLAADVRLDGRFRDLAAAHGLRAGLFCPIRSTVGEVLGLLSLFYPELHDPVEQDVRLAEMATHLAGIAIASRRDQLALAEERNLLRTVIDAMPDQVYAKDRDSRFTLYNRVVTQAIEGVLKEREIPETLIGCTDFDFFHEAAARHFYTVEQRLMETGEPLIADVASLIDESGQVQWWSTTKLPLRDTTGQVIGMVGVSRDVTETYVAQQALAAERNLLRTVIDAIPDLVYAKDRESRFILHNSALTAVNVDYMAGRGIDTLVGLGDWDIFGPEVSQALLAEEQQVMATGRPLVGAASVFIGQAGDVRHLMTTKVPLRDAEGAIIGLVGIGRDVTETHNAQRELARERNLLRTVIDAIPDQVYAKDRDSHFILHNRAVLSVMANPPDGVSWLGLTDLDYYPPELARGYYAVEQWVMATGEPLVDYLAPGTTKDGKTIWVSTTKVPLHDADGTIIGIVGVGRDVTAVQVAQQALAAERNLLRTVIDTIPDQVYAKDREGRYILYNHVVAQHVVSQMGEPVPEETWIGRTDFDLYSAEVARQCHEGEQAVMATGQPQVDNEDQITGPDGEPRWLLMTKVPLRDADGEIVGIVGVGRDITARVLMEQDLREKEEVYRSLIEQSSDMIYLIRNNRFEIVNSAFEQAFGYTLETLQALAEGPLAVVAPSSRQAARHRGQSVRDGHYDGLPRRYEFTALRRDGARFEVEASMAYVPHRDGVAIQGILRDITERKEAEAAMRQLNVELEQRVADRTAEIREQHERIAAILDSVADAVIVTDLAGSVVLTNPVARRLLGETSADTDNASRHIMAVVTWLAAPGAGTDTEVIEVDGTTLEAKAAKVLADGQELGTVIVLRDLTRLLELDRLKTQFVDTVSHELRTPLSNIRLYLSLLRRGRSERQSDYLEVMERESTRLERLISDLLDISRLESAGDVRRREAVDMQQLAAQVIENNTVQAEDKDLVLTYHPAPGDPLPPLWANRDQMVQVLTNLVANAIFYTPDGGTIDLYSRLGCMAEAADSDADDDRPAIILEIADSGIGIEAADLPHIFDRFYRGQNVRNEQVPGTGLGLSITREIVERHYGKIEVESHLNEGSVFRVYLPVTTTVPTSA